MGNPCNPSTGNKYQNEEDYRSGDGSLGYTRAYNSQGNQNTGLGFNWTSSSHKRLEISGSPVQLRRPDGRGEPFTCPSSGNCQGDSDTQLQLTKDANGYTLTVRDKSTERYDLTGKLLSETDNSGRTTNYYYDTNGRLSTVTGSFGHTLTFGYNASGHVSTLTDLSGQAIGYTYDTNNNLTRVDYPDTTAKIYHYENTSFPHHLTGISYVDSAGVTTRYSTYAYDATGKAIRTEHAQTDNGSPQEKFTLTYNSDTQTTVTDPVNMQEVMSFSANLGVKNLTSKVNSSDNKSVTQTFDANNNLTCRKDEENRVALYSYNSTNQKLSMTEGLSGSDCNTCLANPANCNAGGVGRVTTYDYLSPTLDLPRFIRHPSVATGQTFETEIVYGDAGHPNLPTQIIQRGYAPTGTAVSRAVTLGYNTYGQVNSINGPRSPGDPGMNGLDDVTTLEYHSCTTGGKCGQLKKVINTLGQTTRFPAYDANGRVTQMVEPNGAFTTFFYNPRGWLAGELHYPNTSTPGSNYTSYTSYSYNSSGQLARIGKSPGLYGGLVLEFSYDAADDLRSVSESNYYSRWEYSYDLKGNRRQARALGGAGTVALSTDYTHDARNRPQIINSGGNLTQLVFDAVGNLTRETDPNNHATEHQYDALNRLFKTVNALTETATYGHDVNDHMAQAQAPNGATTGLVHDDLGNLLQETSPDRGTTIYTYDNAGNVKTVTDARDVKVTYTYDVLNRVSFVDYPGGTAQDVTFVYDSGPSCTFGLGRLCTTQDQSGITNYGYDAFGNPTIQWRTFSGTSVTFQYAYDEWNRLTQATFPDGRKVNYFYDDLGHTISASATVNGATTLVLNYRDYLTADLMTYQSFGNGLEDLRQYDLAGRLRTQSLGTADNRVYTYDGNGNLTQKQSLPETATYAYDPLDRLTADALHSYSYLPNGNRASDNGAPYSYAAGSNRLTAVNGQGYDYDAAGNLTNRNGYTYAYDKAGRLKQVNFRFLWWTYFTGSYLYDGFGRRAQKLDWNGVTTVFHYDPQGRLLAETTPQGALLRAYVWAEEVPVGQITKDPATGQETLVYLHTDHLNTTRLATNQQGAVVWRWEGGAFGETLPNEDPDGDGVLTTVNWRYAGQYFDSETGLHYNWHRYYDPKVGRYISSDPIGLAGGLNTYTYAYNNPLRWTDPTGLMGFGGGGSANASKPLSLPGNGNVWGGPSPQDMVCSKPMITLNLCVKDCCIAHDECYARNGCNWSSWGGNLAGTGFACQQCNAKAVRCVFSAIGRCDKYPCIPSSLPPFIAP